MADLVTHACTALLPGAFSRSRLVPVVTVGTVLPDLFGRAVPLALERLPVPEAALWPWGALHEPAGWLLVSAGLALVFVEERRRRVLLALWLGCLLHTALDLTQFHHGEGYTVLAPLSLARFELGWIGSEATVPLALPLLGLTAAAWLPRAVEATLGAAPKVDVWGLLWVTVPLHVALPLLGGWLWSTSGPGAVGWALLWVHAAFALFLGASWRWWGGRWVQLGLVLLVDHAVTAATLAAAY